MNIRRPIDYTPLFHSLDILISQKFPPMRLYRAIGGLVSERSEKGAAVAAAEYLQRTYPNIPGLSPRNVRRMRNFYRAYQSDSSLMDEALQLSWSQNIVILEHCHTDSMRAQYLHLARIYGWSKSRLLAEITADRDVGESLDDSVSSCYTESVNSRTEGTHTENPVYLPRQSLPHSHSEIHHEGFYEKGWTQPSVRDCLRRYQPGGTGQSDLSCGTGKASGARDFLQEAFRAAAHQGRLRLLQSSHRDRHQKFTEYITCLWRRFSRRNSYDSLINRPIVHSACFL